jgi:hypothetical protein
MPKKINFERWGSAVANLKELKDTRTLPPEALLITSIDEWKTYKEKYLIMIGPAYPVNILEDKALLLVTLPSAKEYMKSINGSYIIEKIKKRNNELIVYVDSSNEPPINSSDQIKTMFYAPFLINSDIVNKETKITIKKYE